MGVHITFFAIDLPKFKMSLEQSLADILWLYVEHGPEDKGLSYSQLEPSWIRYVALPGANCVRALEMGQQPGDPTTTYDLSRSKVDAIPFLSTQVGDYLGQNHSSSLYHFLRASTMFPSVSWVQEISSGHRRAWIGSFLDCVEESDSISPQEYERATALFQKVLREYNAYKRLPEREYRPSDFAFPVVPADDADLWMGGWTEDETNFVVRLIHSLLDSREIQFKPPSLVANPDGEDEDSWNEWVHSMLKQLLKIESLDYTEVNVVSFIDS